MIDREEYIDKHGCSADPLFDMVDALQTEIDSMRWRMLMLAKLASDEPAFYNVLNVGLAKRIRDEVLRDAS